MEWGPQQAQALTAVGKWLANPNAQQVFRLFGSAGTGKTTLAIHIASMVDGDVAYGAYSGKAALVMRKKGCVGASTIHSMIYRVAQDDATGRLRFKWNGESDVAWVDLIIIDEVSMVDGKMADDLLRFGRKVLVLGDPKQLPPVEGEGFFMKAKPDFMLTEIHRQALDNPIIRLALDASEGRPLKPGAYGTSLVLSRDAVNREEMQRHVLGADQVLCGVNRTRHGLNRRIRELRGLAGKPHIWMPTVGEKLICLRNNRDKNILNGEMFTVEDYPMHVGPKSLTLRVKSLDAEHMSPVDVSVLHPFFLGTDKELDWRDKKGWDEFTFGHALSVHKGQGSQWDNVLIYDESDVFREDAHRHRYTALTRAAERVTVLV